MIPRIFGSNSGAIDWSNITQILDHYRKQMIASQPLSSRETDSLQKPLLSRDISLLPSFSYDPLEYFKESDDIAYLRTLCKLVSAPTIDLKTISIYADALLVYNDSLRAHTDTFVPWNILSYWNHGSEHYSLNFPELIREIERKLENSLAANAGLFQKVLEISVLREQMAFLKLEYYSLLIQKYFKLSSPSNDLYGLYKIANYREKELIEHLKQSKILPFKDKLNAYKKIWDSYAKNLAIKEQACRSKKSKFVSDKIDELNEKILTLNKEIELIKKNSTLQTAIAPLESLYEFENLKIAYKTYEDCKNFSEKNLLQLLTLLREATHLYIVEGDFNTITYKENIRNFCGMIKNIRDFFEHPEKYVFIGKKEEVDKLTTQIKGDIDTSFNLVGIRIKAIESILVSSETSPAKAILRLSTRNSLPFSSEKIKLANEKINQAREKQEAATNERKKTENNGKEAKEQNNDLKKALKQGIKLADDKKKAAIKEEKKAIEELKAAETEEKKAMKSLLSTSCPIFTKLATGICEKKAGQILTSDSYNPSPTKLPREEILNALKCEIDLLKKKVRSKNRSELEQAFRDEVAFHLEVQRMLDECFRLLDNIIAHITEGVPIQGFKFESLETSYLQIRDYRNYQTHDLWRNDAGRTVEALFLMCDDLYEKINVLLDPPKSGEWKSERDLLLVIGVSGLSGSGLTIESFCNEVSKEDYNVNSRDSKNRTLLHFLAELPSQEHLVMAETLIKRGINLHIPEAGSLKRAIHIACESGFLSLVKLLYDCGALIDLPCNEGTPLELAQLHEHHEIAKFLAEKQFATRKGRARLLVDAVKNLDLEKIDTCLVNEKINPNLDFKGTFPLVELFRKEDANTTHVKNICRLLIRNGAKVDLQNLKTGDTPLHAAAQYCRDSELCSFLIELKAPLNVANAFGETPLHLAVRTNKDAWVELLTANNAGVNYRDNIGWTPLIYACELRSSINIIRLLLDAGANPNDATEYGSVLHHAVEQSSQEVVELLLERGANPLVLGKKGNYYRKYPFQVAVSSSLQKALIEPINTIITRCPLYSIALNDLLKRIKNVRQLVMPEDIDEYEETHQPLNLEAWHNSVFNRLTDDFSLYEDRTISSPVTSNPMLASTIPISVPHRVEVPGLVAFLRGIQLVGEKMPLIPEEILKLEVRSHETFKVADQQLRNKLEEALIIDQDYKTMSYENFIQYTAAFVSGRDRPVDMLAFEQSNKPFLKNCKQVLGKVSFIIDARDRATFAACVAKTPLDQTSIESLCNQLTRGFAPKEALKNLFTEISDPLVRLIQLHKLCYTALQTLSLAKESSSLRKDVDTYFKQERIEFFRSSPEDVKLLAQLSSSTFDASGQLQSMAAEEVVENDALLIFIESRVAQIWDQLYSNYHHYVAKNGPQLCSNELICLAKKWGVRLVIQFSHKSYDSHPGSEDTCIKLSTLDEKHWELVSKLDQEAFKL